jgi:hypothetical protein
MKRKRIWDFVFVAAAIGTGVVLSLKPWKVYVEQRKMANEKVSEMQEAENSRAKLMEQKYRLESSTGREETARKYGYMKPGEQPVTD